MTSMVFILIPLWIVLCVIVGIAARGRGQGAFGWFFLSLFISPLIAAIFLLLFQRDTSGVDDREIRRAIKAGRRRW
jgi:uncharacterized membrane protein